MRDRGDRLLLRGGVLLPAEPADQPVVAGLQPSPGADGVPGGLDQHRLDVGPGIAGAAVLALAGADVVAGAQGHPGGQLLVADEVQVRGRADLGQPRLRHHVAEARDGLQQALLAPPPGGQSGDLLTQPRDGVIEQRDPVPVQAAQQRVVPGEPAGQGHGQVRELARCAHPANRQVRQHAAAAFPVDQRIDHRRGRDPGNTAGHRAELDPG
jgi:hypothetical protein